LRNIRKIVEVDTFPRFVISLHYFYNELHALV